MSETSKISVGNEAESLLVSPVFQAYSGVDIVVDENTMVSAGNSTQGRVLTIENPWGTKAQAKNILATLKARGFQYQPFSANNVILDPAAEIGDGISVKETYSGIYKLTKKFTQLMLSDVVAPQDEELDHEYPFEPKQDRIYKREIAESKAAIRINASAITAEVQRASETEGELRASLTLTASALEAEIIRATEKEGTLSTRISATESSIETEVSRATEAEGQLSSRITQNAESIEAKVSATSTGSSFGWELTASEWKIKSNGNVILRASADGLVIKGKITATSGYIGNGTNGFTITDTAIYNKKNNLEDTEKNGIYIGTDGIALGKGKFKVTSAGAVSASNLTITGGSITIGDGAFRVDKYGNLSANNAKLSGTLNIGGTNISADVLRSGAQSAYSSGGYWSGGAGYGYNYNNATKESGGVYPSFFKASVLSCTTIVISNRSFTVYSLSAEWKTKSFYDRDGNYVVIQYLGH